MLDLIGAAINVDIFLFYIINSNFQNSYFTFLMPLITNAGLYIFWISVCTILAIFGGEKGRNVTLILLIAIIMGYIFSELIKYIVMRPRPYQALTGVNQLAALNTPSFPSGHATQVVISSVILDRKYGYILLFLLLAVIVSFSRVYIGVHYPGDVIAGALLGIGISILILHFENDILKLKNRLIHK